MKPLTIAALMLTLAPSSARANIAAPTGEPAYRSEAASPATPLEVSSETLTFDRRREEEPACDFAAVYRITNPADAVQSTTPVFYGVRSQGLSIEGIPWWRASVS